MEEQNIDSNNFRKALYDKFRDFLNDEEVSKRYMDLKKTECYEAIGYCLTILSSEEDIKLDINFLKEIDVNFTRMQQEYEKFKALNGQTFSLCSSSDEEECVTNYVMTKKIKWKMPKKIKFISPNITQNKVKPMARVAPYIVRSKTVASHSRSTTQSNSN